MDLTPSGNEPAANWIAWAGAEGHDSYWRFHRQALFGLLPPPGKLTIDLGCGEGRVTRDLSRVGHRVVGFDLSAPIVAAAAHHRQAEPFVVADAAVLPVADGQADLVVAFMSVQGMNRPLQALAEISRVLAPQGRLHLAIVHPINAARHVGLVSDPEHRLLTQYSQWLEQTGFVIDAIREVAEPDPGSAWYRIPLFLHLGVVKAPDGRRDRRLFHIAAPADADRLMAERWFEPPSVAVEGFIHLSTARQVLGSTERHFDPSAELVLVELEPELLQDEVRWPEVYPGERFPHLHGVLRADSVVAIHPWGPADRARWADGAGA